MVQSNAAQIDSAFFIKVHRYSLMIKYSITIPEFSELKGVREPRAASTLYPES